MSATVSSCVPALFIVPTTTFSPSSMLRRVTMPSNGAIERHLPQVVAAGVERGGLLLDHLLARFGRRSARARSSVSRTFSVGSPPDRGVSCVVSCCAHSSRCRFTWSRRAQVRPRGLDVDPRLREPGARAGDRRLAALHRAAQGVRVDLEQELARLHAVAFLDGQPGHAAHLHGADVHEALRLDLARGRDDGLEVALLHGLGVDVDGCRFLK